MRWEPPLTALEGRALPGGTDLRIALRVPDLSLCLLGPDAAPLAELALNGRSLTDAYRWASEAVRTATRGAHERPLIHPGFQLPEHPLARDGRRARSRLVELARWFGNADAELRRLAQAIAPGRCLLARHFDIATLIEIESGRTAAPTGVGVGLSRATPPSTEPYLYANHCWRPPARAPPLAAGNGSGRDGSARCCGQPVVAAGDGAARWVCCAPSSPPRSGQPRARLEGSAR
jgi:hypothetical protein